MKRLAIVVLVLLAVPLFATAEEERDRTPRRTLVDEVIRMTTAGVNDEAIVEYIRKSDDRDDVTADDLIALTDAKASKDVIRAVIDHADDRNGTPRRGTRERTVYRPYYSSYYGYGWGDPFYDPFWYGPRVNIGFGWGWGYRPYGGRVFVRGGGGHHRGRGRH
ncbi:MAG TPA: hypothetical protein VKB93_15480 [Thermoanaerobaculia bacterium]|nr:hypothetical protein [Thermoanaerobaculia bacterium]